ncbi:hypothetical protein [Niabella ginsengisoli]|uniref:Sialate O-acetylesterase n=1 Tax=Niabella ginsengisoli TaxID=522298 RepID=A0ABS9SHG9_9BACT|nr:hypothetical protein [Niabella ginsengisoli]MCH5597807.1 hypothetical protein [Niabella ginsengisoli]
MIKRFLILFFLGVFSTAAEAKLVVPKILGNNMVLQQGVPVAIWGWADPGNKVTVTFKGKSKVTVADTEGDWKVYLDPVKASFDAALLNITTSEEHIQLTNVLVGEVWLCSGQSNMEFPMRKLEKLKPPPGVDWPVNELEKVDNKFIRTFLVERKKCSPIQPILAGL